MRFNLWYENVCEERNADFGALLRWLGDLLFEKDLVADIIVKEAKL